MRVEHEADVSYINNRTVHDRRYFGLRPVLAIMTDLIMAKINSAQVESSTGGLLLSGSRTAMVSGISIDSRTVRMGRVVLCDPRPSS